MKSCKGEEFEGILNDVSGFLPYAVSSGDASNECYI